MKKDILICDANHGGLTLLDEYYKYTKNNLFFYDVYDKLTSSQKEEYHSKYNVRFLKREDIDDDYTVIGPVHMKPIVKTDYTHHEFTSYLVNKHKDKYNWDFKIIQITGVKGKTTTTSLISNILKNKNRLVLTSNSLTYHTPYDKKILKKGLSITPSSIITALNIAVCEDIIYDIDYFIAEVSLGVIDCGDISVLTNILEDYPIASKTSDAHTAKESVFKNDIVICDKKSLDNYYGSYKDVFSVDFSDKTADLYAEDINYNIDKTSFKVVSNKGEFKVKCFALTDFYINNILFAVSVGLILEVDIEDIKSSLENMKSIPGRTSYRYIDDSLVIEEINPGLNTTSIRESIENIHRYNDSFIIILGGDYGITCEEIDESKLLDYIRTLDKKQIIFTGSLGYNLYKNTDNDNYHYIKEVNQALRYSLKNNYKLIEVIYRSRYAREVSLDV